MSIAVAESAHDPKSPASNPGPFFKRAYQACINCRKRKVKCIIECYGNGRLQSSCTRCKRELRQCTFSADRRTQTSTKSNTHASQRTVQILEDQPTQLDRQPEQMPRRESVSRLPLIPVSPTINLPQGNDSYAPRNRKRPWSETDQSTSVQSYESTGAYSQTNVDQESFTDPGTYQTASSPKDAFGVPLHDRECSVHTENPVVSGPNGTLEFGISLEDNTDATSHLNSVAHSSTVENYVESWSMVRHPLSVPSQETLQEWSAWRFVLLGWMTAQEAVTYIDLFFQNMSILSPILHDYYQDHSNHHALITREPVLCCTIIALSARYHMLSGDGGLSRGYYIHDRLWKHCQSLFHRIVWDQRRAVKDQIRHLGTIESFLLVTEWHPRSAHIAPDIDFWESDMGAFEGEENLCHSKVPNKWLQEVEETAQRSDRMSWMLLGGALTLGHELDLFDDNDDAPIDASSDGANLSFANYLLLRRSRLRRLLFVYISQLASRIGCALPKTPFHTTISSSMAVPHSILDRQWHDHMTSWIELSRLVRTSSEFLFPSKSVTRELLRSGRYCEFLDHFRPLLSQWLEKYQQNSNPSLYHQFLTIDYQFVRLYINSLALQAVANRMAKYQTSTMGSQSEGTQDFGFIREVISGSKKILELVIKLADDNHLKYIPVRIYIRIASAAIYLINALALGVRRDELDESLSLLDRSVQALRWNAVDDVHLGVRFASLLGNHIKGLRERFVRVYSSVTSPPFGLLDAQYSGREAPGVMSVETDFRTDLNQRHGTISYQGSPTDVNFSMPSLLQPVEHSGTGMIGNSSMKGRLPVVEEDTTLSGRDWFALPFDASKDTFDNNFMQSFFEIDPVDTRFFWDLSL